MNGTELTEVVRQCCSPFRRDLVNAVFCPMDNIKCLWYKFKNKNGEEGINFSFPDYLEDAPYSVIRDVTKSMIQEMCYGSYHKYSRDTTKWLMSALDTPDKIQRFNERNGYRVLDSVNGIHIVEHDGDSVQKSAFFKTIAIPENLDADSKTSIITRECVALADRIETLTEV